MKCLTNRNLIKEVNENKVINLLVENNELTKFEISRILNISIPTVTTNINKLKYINLVEEVESDIYTGGRKPKIIKFNSNAKVSIGVSIYSNRINYTVLNLAKEPIYNNQNDLEFKTFDEIIINIKYEVEKILKHLNIKKESVLGIGISIPGVINEKTNMIEHTNVDISNVSLDKYDNIIPYNLYYDNEANLSLLAEKTFTVNRSKASYIYLSINEGLGGGIIINEALYKGSFGRAGEFGHLIMNVDEKSLESYVSSKNIIKTYNKKSLNKINNIKEFEECIEKNDALALDIINDAIKILSRGLYNLIIVFDPGMILIGGELSNIIKRYDKQIKKSLKINNDLKYTLEVEIIYSQIDKPELLGAALVPLLDFLTLDLTNI